MASKRTENFVIDCFCCIGTLVLFAVGSAVQIMAGGHGAGTAGMFVVLFVTELFTGGTDVSNGGIAALAAFTGLSLCASLAIYIFPLEYRIVPIVIFATAAGVTWLLPIFLAGEYWPLTAIAGVPILLSVGLAIGRFVATSQRRPGSPRPSN